MNINDKLYGFIIKSKETVAEQAGVLYLMEHESSGARLGYLEREDANKTFAIAFPTLPENDTGVFHIIEHSVLCGSRKFPVKEPFVELLKGSLNTFLNAMTYDDRTVYPVSSRNDKDFYNLTDVYLDAVFHPAMRENSKIFRQEGWHLEESEGTLSYNGVVYNEMKGAYSSPDELGMMALNRALFGGTAYGRDSGGDPKAIPSLSYGDFLAAHEKYYHPSNSYIYLDGSARLGEILPLIDSYLSEYERRDIKISFPKSEPRDAGETVIKYEAPEGEQRPRARLILGYVFSGFEDSKALLATTLLCDILAGSNEAPLKKALLDKGLAEEVSVYTNRTNTQTVIIEIRGIDEESKEKIKDITEKTVKELAEGGIPRDRLSATLNRIEFKMREADYGALPRGVANALSAYSSWLYGGSLAEALGYEETLAELRAELDSDYFERTLLSATLNSPHRASVLMLPDTEAGSKTESEEAERLSALKKSLTEEELSMLKEESAALAEWQASEDSEEALFKLPKLSLEDISPLPQRILTDKQSLDGAEILLHKIETNGIMYTTLYFNASDFDKEELTLLSVLSTVITNLPTESYEPLELKSAIKSSLGGFTATPSVISLTDGSGAAAPTLAVSASALLSKKQEIPRLLREVLLTSKFDRRDIIKKILLQLRALSEDALSSGADTLAIERIEAMTGVGGALNEYLTGFESFRKIAELANSFDATADAVIEKLSALAERIFLKRRLTVAVTGEGGEEYAASLIKLFPDGTAAPKTSLIQPLGKGSEGIAIPARVSHAALGATLQEARELLGPLRVARSILSYEYLWNSIRVRGGAYGTGFVTRRTGLLLFYSYRDPSPARSLECYRSCADYLRSLAADSTDLTKFIIGAIGEYDILTTPRSAAAQATSDILTGWSYERECELRKSMLGTTPESLIKVAELLERVTASPAVCVAGARAVLEKIPGVLENVLTL